MNATPAPPPLWNAANLMTMARLVAAPAILALALMARAPGEAGFAAWVTPVMLGVLVLALLTDWWDGLFARGYGVVTDFGKIMDPVADSTFFMTLFFALSASDRFAMPVWIPILVLYREIAMHVLRRYAALKQVVLAARVSGKAKTVVQSVLTVLLLALAAARDTGLLEVPEATLRALTLWFGVVIVLASLLSLAEYLRHLPALAAGRLPGRDGA
jgi:CDP-diacylglycerol--glycerol-3-phosphate 3-phosphatidyltransferase